VQPRAKGRLVDVEILRGRRTVLWATWMLSAGRGTTEVDLASRGGLFAAHPYDAFAGRRQSSGILHAMKERGA